jgi:hypothetical protein
MREVLPARDVLPRGWAFAKDVMNAALRPDAGISRYRIECWQGSSIGRARV